MSCKTGASTPMFHIIATFEHERYPGSEAPDLILLQGVTAFKSRSHPFKDPDDLARVKLLPRSDVFEGDYCYGCVGERTSGCYFVVDTISNTCSTLSCYRVTLHSHVVL